jgi:transcriptional regulator with XRE-family HTH domain
VTTGESHVPLATRLRQALEEQGLSQRELARRVIARTDGAAADPKRVENERRQIGRYLAGTHRPEPVRARLYAELLGQPENYFIDETPVRLQLAEQISTLAYLVGVLTSTVETRLGELEGDDLPVRALARTLEAVEETLSKQGAAMTEALQAVESRLERVEAAMVASAAPQSAQGRTAK